MGEIHAKETPKRSRPNPIYEHPPIIWNVDHYYVHENVDMHKINQENLNVLTYPENLIPIASSSLGRCGYSC
jgi:hypothetical protein